MILSKVSYYVWVDCMSFKYGVTSIYSTSFDFLTFLNFLLYIPFTISFVNCFCERIQNTSKFKYNLMNIFLRRFRNNFMVFISDSDLICSVHFLIDVGKPTFINLKPISLIIFYCEFFFSFS